MKLRSLVIAVMLTAGSVMTAQARTATLKLLGASAGPPKLDKKRLEIERHIWTAQYYVVRAGDLVGAAKEYKAVLALDPQNEEAALALASIYTHDKKDKEAIAVLEKLTKKNPKSKDAWLMMGEIQLQGGDMAGLKASVAKVLSLDARNTTAYWMLFQSANKRFRAGDAAAKPEALEAARKLAQLTRGRSDPTYKVAERAVVELGGQPIDLVVYDAKAAFASAFDGASFGAINAQMARARKGFEDCTRQTPDNEECHYYLGMVYSSVKASEAYDLKKALAELALAPTMPMAWVERARILRATDKNADARAALEKALTLDSRLAAAHVELGIIAKVDGDTEQAVAQLVEAINDDRYGAAGERAFTELSKIDPTHPLVTEGMLTGKAGDVFSTEQYKSTVNLIEQSYGGVEPKAPERAVVEEVVRRLREGSAIKQEFPVQVVAAKVVNAFALADGRVYVTRGFLDMLVEKNGGKPVDANNAILGHIMGHELTHVIRKHTLHNAIFQQAIKDSTHPLDPAVLTHCTRLHEIEADREGMVMAFLAGYQPRGGIEFMEIMGQRNEVPKHLDHPTFEERVQYLTDYWTNDVRYAFVSFKLGVGELDRGAALEGTDMAQAVVAYQAALEHFKRFHAMLPSLKEAMNDLGIAYAKLGVLAMNQNDSPLGRWQTRFSLERESAVKYVNLVRDEGGGRTRGAEKARIPSQLREAIGAFKEALAVDEEYSKARLNLATVYLAANQLDNANATLAKVQPRAGVSAGEVDLIRGVALAEAKGYDGAKQAFEKALASPDANRAAAYNLAKTLELAGKKVDAKRAYQDYLKAYPGGPWGKAAESAAAKL
jgi:predicted Zn-dependent protease